MSAILIGHAAVATAANIAEKRLARLPTGGAVRRRRGPGSPDDLRQELRHLTTKALVKRCASFRTSRGTRRVLRRPGEDAVYAAADPRRHDQLDFKHESADWAASQLIPEAVAYLDSMPFSHRLSLTERADDDLIVTHANPADRTTFIVPPDHEQLDRLGEVAMHHDQGRIDALLVGVEAGAVAVGHFHLPHTQTSGSTLIVNASSVSNPMDGGPRANYALLRWSQPGGWAAEIVRVRYDRAADRRALRRLRPPNWELLTRILDG